MADDTRRAMFAALLGRARRGEELSADEEAVLVGLRDWMFAEYHLFYELPAGVYAGPVHYPHPGF